MSSSDLASTVQSWLAATPGAQDAAKWLLDRAESDGQIPKQLTLDVDISWHIALASFFSTNYVRLSARGRKITPHFDRWEREHLGQAGTLLPVLAEAFGRKLANRKQERRSRQDQIVGILKTYANDGGLTGHVAGREQETSQQHQGRFWSRSSRWTAEQIQAELDRYMNLLRYTDALRHDAIRIERVVHVSRKVAGDTHWMRPRNQVWRDLADDLLGFDSELATQFQGLDTNEVRSRALAEVGIVENLTSVVVLVFGRFAIKRGAAMFRWPSEAAAEGLPVWLSALHLAGSEILSDQKIERVVCVENETSFLDLVEQHRHETTTVCIYTEGQANRAVIALLRLIAHSFPAASFEHHGDLDLPGVRILASLMERTGLDIQPINMGAKTHERFERAGIALTEEEHSQVIREILADKLPCQDLLQCLAKTRLRIEQEVITGCSAATLPMQQ